MQSFIRACIEFDDYFDYMFREQSEVHLKPPAEEYPVIS